MVGPYGDEAITSWVVRAVARGWIGEVAALQAPQQDLEPNAALMLVVAKLADGPRLMEQLKAQALIRRWPAAELIDLSANGSEHTWLGKVCELCLGRDAAEGRDHYIRQEWRLAWRVSCREHLVPLTDVEAAELVPVEINGQRERRVRLLRQYELQADRFLRMKGRGGGGRGVMLPVPLLRLEEDIIGALAGKAFPDIWCSGRQWPRVRQTLIALTDLLLSPSRVSRERLIQLVRANSWMPQTQTLQFVPGGFNLLGTMWQRRILESAATLLLDPDRYVHWWDGGPIRPHEELSYGILGRIRTRGPLGRLATQDLLCLVLSYAGDPALQALDQQIPTWAPELRRRIRSAAAVALHLP